MKTPAITVEEVERVNRKAWTIRLSEPHEAMRLAGQGLEWAQEIGYELGRARSCHLLGQCHYRIGEYSLGAKYCEDAAALFGDLGDPMGQAGAINTIGNVHSFLGDHHTAYTFYLKTLQVLEMVGNPFAIAATWNNIGNVHFNLRDFENSLDAHRRSLAIKESIADRDGVGASYINLGNVHREMGDLERALEHYEQALPIVREAGNRYSEASALGNMALMYCKMDQPELARDYNIQSLRIQRETEHKDGEARALLQLGELYARFPGLIDEAGRSGFEAAGAYLNEALQLGTELNGKGILLDAHKYLAELYEAGEQHAEALEHVKLVYRIEREMFDQEMSEKTKNLMVLHQVETARKDAALELAEAGIARLRNIELASALAEAERQRHAAEEANRFKTKLLSIAAHDLRNPLNGISGFANLLLGSMKAVPHESEMLSQILISSRQMERLIDDLLESSVVESGQLNLQLQSVDVSKIAVRVVALNEQRARKKNQQLLLAAPEGAVICADELRMWQVLDNLVSNAIKYSPKGKRIWIDVTCDEPWVHCRVRDEGPGLSAGDLLRIFGRFERLSAKPTGDEQTTGLGLSIAKQLVDLQEGRLWAESPGPGQGSTFVLEFPAQAES